MKVLHIVHWYPSKFNEKEALWIQNHIHSLRDHFVINNVFHLNISKGKMRLSISKNALILIVPFLSWRVCEILSAIFLFAIIKFKGVNKKYDLLNFHIAYPNLVYWYKIKKNVKPKVVITEHWSAYHFNFGLLKPPPRIQKIFKERLPVIAVSEALLDDLRAFSCDVSLVGFKIPNVVNTNIFFDNDSIVRQPNRYFMVGQWKSPKKPQIIIEAFQILLKKRPQAKLVIGGYGPLSNEMHEQVQILKISNNVTFLGTMDEVDIALEMNKAAAYVHCSEYETFSVVCAEALHCGCPVIASKVGGIPEFVTTKNGCLVSDNTKHSFALAMDELANSKRVLDKPDFSSAAIGKQYSEILREIRE